MTEKELLAVLDMSEEEQRLWCVENTEPGSWAHLADLAFRLRDEVMKENNRDFHDAIYKVMMKVEGDDKWATAFWGGCLAKPIHWIIAALIAKEKE